MELAVVGAVGMLGEEHFGTDGCFVIGTLRKLDLGDVVGHGLVVLGCVLQALESRQGLVVFLQLVHAVGVVIGAPRSVAAVALAELREVYGRALVLLQHEVGVPAIESIVRLVLAREGVEIDRLEVLEALLVMTFLDLDDTLHEFYLIGKGGIGEGLQIGLEVVLQLLVARRETLREGFVAGLHLRRLGGEGKAERQKYRYSEITV